ncbi:predicted protein [Uncinocarpus reesii 1704]|uniref:Calcineurin-like phosphoesterase domain-containing protein n=1 Tax=Uncinocarpus reesii (strain UAMH 1704) TaxID=336963 RepID=C4JUZ2_UNCRE|nr:uncharacterized protein UREG_04945 [Uncinocarpus reesii 1704]EEP80103.1 predicted protein [Uncinocarpus reesii 1704]
MRWNRHSDFDKLVKGHRFSNWEQFLSSPIVFLATVIYRWATVITSLEANNVNPLLGSRANSTSPITVVCISDTHNNQLEIPDGDILLHAGDLTQSGSRSEIQAAIDWLNTLPHQHKVVIAGNHDLFLDPSCTRSTSLPQRSIEWGNVTYLQNNCVTLKCVNRNIKVYGNPWSPRQGNWAFQYPRVENVWKDMIPSDIDILLTHTPPKGHLDLNYGCGFLLQELWKLEKRPKLHVFGHIHAGYGQQVASFDDFQSQFEAIIRGNATVVNSTNLPGVRAVSVVGARSQWLSLVVQTVFVLRKTTLRALYDGSVA